VGAPHIEARVSQSPWTTATPVTIGLGTASDTYKNADLWHTSQWKLCLHWDSLFGAQTATVSPLLAATPADARKTNWLTVTRPLMQGRQTSLQLSSYRCRELAVTRPLMWGRLASLQFPSCWKHKCDWLMCRRSTFLYAVASSTRPNGRWSCCGPCWLASACFTVGGSHRLILKIKVIKGIVSVETSSCLKKEVEAYPKMLCMLTD
jgi:hypothetical protein